MSNNQTARSSWPLLAAFSAVVLGGLALVLGFAHFNALHQEFLGANFDSVHGARTLLKAQFLADMAARDLEAAAASPARRQALLVNAERRLVNAESYAAEGRDQDQKARAELASRVRAVRSDVSHLAHQLDEAQSEAELPAITASLYRLARDFESAELDRWGTLSSLNTELSSRMRQINNLIGGIVLFFVAVMATLGWALLRARRAEADLLEAKASTEAIQQTTLEASPIGIAYIDTSNLAERRVAAANQQMAKIFGYEHDMMVGMNVRRLYASKDSYDRYSNTAPEQLAGGEVLREEIVMQRRNGTPFWCSLSIKAIDPSAIERGVVWTCEDISERKAGEEELMQARAKAEAASRAKSDFLANMSHELRTPFAGLFGLLDLMQRTSLDENQQRYLRFARDSTTQMQAIVNDILDFSKIEAGKLLLDISVFNPRQLVESLAETHAASAANKGLGFRLDLIEPLPEKVLGDAVRIRQIIDNLVGNAVKFTPQGEVRLRVSAQPQPDERVRLEVKVIDTGIGIAPDMLDRIFEKFTQADSSTTRNYGGTGLGLTISNQLAMLMNGSISVHSQEGRGSEFVLDLTLPLANGASHATSDAAPRPGCKAGALVLLVEDNPINRSMFAEQLEHFGLRVQTAENGEQAVRLAAEISPDVILMDCQMPVMDGLEATRRIRAAEGRWQHVPIIAITAFTTSNYRDACLEAGMDRFLPKPVSPETLVAEIGRLLEKPPAAPQLRGNVLLVEDNASIQEATRHLLEHFGCTVACAADGNSALELLKAASGEAATSEEFDLVLMDCHLPGMDGWETARRWRDYEQARHLLPVGIIALTAEEPAAIRQRSTEAGMDDILCKPFDERQLQALLAEWLGDDRT